MNTGNDFILRMLERLDEKMDNLVRQQAEQKTSLDTHVRVEEASLGEVKDAVSKNSEHLSEYNAQLKEHMRRTDLLEARVLPLEDDLEKRLLKQSFIAQHWKKVSLVASILAAAGGAIWSAVQIWGSFSGKV